MSEKEAEEQEFFMCIQNPAAFRKNLLEASKIVLSIVKQTYTVQQLREEKHELMSEISKEMKEIQALADKIEDRLPRYSKEDLKKLLPEAPPRKANAQPKDKPAAHPKKKAESPELEKLSRALEEVQRKLQGL